MVDASGVLRDNVRGQGRTRRGAAHPSIALYGSCAGACGRRLPPWRRRCRRACCVAIGDPDDRYREDPVRIIRSCASPPSWLRRSSRAPASRSAPAPSCSPAVPAAGCSRRDDQAAQTATAGNLEEPAQMGLHSGIFPILDVVLADAPRDATAAKFIQLALWPTPTAVSPGASRWRRASCWRAHALA